MATSVQYKDKLEGSSNYLQWKVQISVVLKENKLWNFVNTTVVPPVYDPTELDLHEIKEAKAQRIILNGAKDHLRPHLLEKDTAKKIWDAFTKLYHDDYYSQNMTLKDKLHGTRMSKGKSMTFYLSKVIQGMMLQI